MSKLKFIHEGKLKNYLTYALGEIVLIVAGILLALQIDNYNQDRIDHEEEMRLLNNYINDLETDILRINEAVEGDKIILAGQDTLLSLIANHQQSEFNDRKLLLYTVKYTYWYLTAEFSELAISQLKYSDGLQLIEDNEILNAILHYDEGISSCKKVYLELERYFHVQEESQKEIFNLSLAKNIYVLFEQDLSNMFKPGDDLNKFIVKGKYLVQSKSELLNKNYNDLLFYRTTLNNVVIYLTAQKEKAIETIKIIKSRIDKE